MDKKKWLPIEKLSARDIWQLYDYSTVDVLPGTRGFEC